MQTTNANSTPAAIRYRVLLVDDDELLLRSMAANLESEFDIVTCNSADRALTLITGGDFHVVCTDYSMPGMTGLELLERVANLSHPVGCLLVTGASAFLNREHGGPSNHYVLVKPIAQERLSTLILQLARTAEMKRGGARVKLV